MNLKETWRNALSTSQNNFPRSRRFTYIALALGLLSAVAVCLALVQIDALEREYGGIRSDIQRFHDERTEAQGRRERLLSEISQDGVKADGISKTIASLTADRDRLSAEIKQQEASRAEGAERMRTQQEQAKAAEDTIAVAALAETKLAGVRAEITEGERKISSNQLKIDQTNADISRAETKKRAADEALSSTQKSVQDRQADVIRLNSEIEYLDQKRREVSDLDARQTNLKSQITKLTTDLADKQSSSRELDTDFAKLQDLVSKAKASAAKADADAALLETSRADLSKEVRELESRKASLTGDVSSLTSAADRARGDAAAAEGRTKVAQDAIAEAEKELPSFRAQLRELQSDIAVTTTQRDTAKSELFNLQATQSKLGIDRADADRASSEKTILLEAVRGLSDRHAEVRKELELGQSDLNTLKAELADLNGRKGALLQEIAALSEIKPPKPVEAVPDEKTPQPVEAVPDQKTPEDQSNKTELPVKP